MKNLYHQYMLMDGNKSDIESFKNTLLQCDNISTVTEGAFNSLYFIQYENDIRMTLERILPKFDIKLFILVYPCQSDFCYELVYNKGILKKYERFDSNDEETEAIAKPYKDLIDPFLTLYKDK